MSSLIPPLRSSTNRLSHPPSLSAQISARQERIRKRATRDLSTRTSRTDFFDGDSSSDVVASKSKHFSVLEYLRQSPSPTPSPATSTPRSGVMEAVAEEGESVGGGGGVREERKRGSRMARARRSISLGFGGDGSEKKGEEGRGGKEGGDVGLGLKEEISVSPGVSFVEADEGEKEVEGEREKKVGFVEETKPQPEPQGQECKKQKRRWHLFSHKHSERTRYTAWFNRVF